MEKLRQSVPAGVGWALLAGRDKRWREGLRGQLLTVAHNVRWFLAPRDIYLWPKLGMVVGLAGLALLLIAGGWTGVWIHFGKWAQAHAPEWIGEEWGGALALTGPLILGLVLVGLYASTAGARADIAAQEFIAYLRERLVA
jgi:hypothetical protein